MKLQKLLTYFLSAFLSLSFVTATLSATSITAFEECAKELVTYFPELIVNETLKKFEIPENQWEEINRDLTEKDKNIVKTVEEKAQKMSPNPLKDPQQRQAAVKLFKETLYTAFSDVLEKHNITDEKQIQAMLDDIQQQKAKKFASCLEKHKSDIAPNRSEKKQTEDEEQTLADTLPQKTFNAQIRPGMDLEFSHEVPQDPSAADFREANNPPPSDNIENRNLREDFQERIERRQADEMNNPIPMPFDRFTQKEVPSHAEDTQANEVFEEEEKYTLR